jgi:4-hydroxy-2-oxoheptanedioate aldolase
MQNKLRTLWNEDASAVNAWLGIPSTVTAEIVSRQGFDAITIDLQHGINDYSSAVPMLQAMSASDATPMVRVPWLEPGIIMKLLDAGALGVICPMINTPADAERAATHPMATAASARCGRAWCMGRPTPGRPMRASSAWP